MLLADMGLMEHYIIPADSNIVKCDYQHSHPVLVVPVEYFQKQRGKARLNNPAMHDPNVHILLHGVQVMLHGQLPL